MRRTLVVALLISALTTPSAMAQIALATDARGAQPQGDSLAMLRALEDAVRRNPNDHAAWNRRGTLAWSIARTVRRRGNDVSSTLSDIADSSLRRAVELNDTSARYLVDLARFRWASRSSLTRRHAPGMFERAHDLARERGDNVAMADALAALGTVAWRKYEGIADRHIYSAIFRDPDAEGLIDDEYAIAYFVENQSRLAASKHWSGQGEYEDARKKFVQALEADPNNRRARAGLFMLLVERKRWEEARHEALLRLRNAPCDALAWMTRGLAAHRLSAVDEATAAFDSALVCLPPHERERLDVLTRVLKPRDGDQYTRLPADERLRTEQLYWLMSDPLWLTRANE
ncbi:MAG: tetratricopeptide repeat protein, partial [Gemmatimonadota bacterium]|nr:tetratricopeptide repeat protein [Gemmatimonadota bacterium]